MTTLRKIGIDPGFSTIKIAEIQDGEMTAFSEHSTVGLQADTDLNLDLLISGGRTIKPRLVEFDDRAYLVGRNVHHYTQPLYRMDFERFSDSPELRASLYNALARLLSPGLHRVALAIALPVQVVPNKAFARKIEAKISDWLLGAHQFNVNGQTYTLDVETIKATIAQPVATWMDWGMNLAGQWGRGKEMLERPTIVIDPGFNTIDVFAVEGGSANNRLSGGETLGMRLAAQNLIGLTQKRLGQKLDLMQADEYIRAGDATFYQQGQPVPGKPLIEQAISAHWAQVSQHIEQVASEASGYVVLITGGGGLAYATRLRTLINHAQLMDDPITAQARGAAKIAARVWG